MIGERDTSRVPLGKEPAPDTASESVPDLCVPLEEREFGFTLSTSDTLFSSEVSGPGTMCSSPLPPRSFR